MRRSMAADVSRYGFNVEVWPPCCSKAADAPAVTDEERKERRARKVKGRKGQEREGGEERRKKGERKNKAKRKRTERGRSFLLRCVLLLPPSLFLIFFFPFSSLSFLFFIPHPCRSMAADASKYGCRCAGGGTRPLVVRTDASKCSCRCVAEWQSLCQSMAADVPKCGRRCIEV